MKLPQMFQVANLGVAIHHNFNAKTTVGFVHGWHVFNNINVVSETKLTPHSETLLKMILSTRSCLGHPLLLPIVLLNDHLSRELKLQLALSEATTGIEKNLGMTKSSRLAMSKSTMDPVTKKMIASPDARVTLIELLNTTSTDLVLLNKVMKWDLQFIAYLHRVNRKVSRHLPHNPPVEEEICSLIDYLEGSIMSAMTFTDTMLSRLELQTTALYNLIGHAANDLNSKIAVIAGLDSTAMKTLAFVTIVFLPPTFIATLFSMSMFDWQASAENGDETTLVRNFWIYWAVAIPLTVLIILAWRVWWHFQRSFYEKKYMPE
jgi:hypothetical protein